jgi:protein involved in polysaccharide export with SLBB domain
MVFNMMRAIFRCFAIIAFAGLMTLCGCRSSASKPTATIATEVNSSGQYILSGGVSDSGPHPLHAGDTVSIIIARNLVHPPSRSVTVVLIRTGPDGKTRQLIELTPQGELMDEKQNYTLRDGDELLFPAP